MKKALSLVLAILFAFSIVGCGDKKETITKENMQFAKTAWGMTLSKTCNALGIKQEDLKKVDGANAYEYANYKYDGVLASLILHFTSAEDQHGKLYSQDLLHSVNVFVENKEQLDKIVDNLKKDLGEPDNKSSDGRALTWNSATNVSDSFKDNNIYETFLTKYETEMYTDLDRSEGEIAKRIDGLKLTFSQTPIESIKTASLDDVGKYYITYTGTAACYAKV